MTGGRRQSGFTLLEVLVALTILAVGGALVLSLMSGSLGNIRRVQLKDRAIQHAETVMEIALLDDSVKQPTARQGDFEDGTRFTVKIEEYEPNPEQELTPEQIQQQLNLRLKLFRYTVEVTGPESAAPDFRLQTLKVVNTTELPGPTGVQR